MGGLGRWPSSHPEAPPSASPGRSVPGPARLSPVQSSRPGHASILTPHVARGLDLQAPPSTSSLRQALTTQWTLHTNTPCALSGPPSPDRCLPLSEPRSPQAEAGWLQGCVVRPPLRRNCLAPGPRPRGWPRRERGRFQSGERAAGRRGAGRPGPQRSPGSPAGDAGPGVPAGGRSRWHGVLTHLPAPGMTECNPIAAGSAASRAATQAAGASVAPSAPARAHGQHVSACQAWCLRGRGGEGTGLLPFPWFALKKIPVWGSQREALFKPRAVLKHAHKAAAGKEAARCCGRCRVRPKTLATAEQAVPSLPRAALPGDLPKIDPASLASRPHPCQPPPGSASPFTGQRAQAGALGSEGVAGQHSQLPQPRGAPAGPAIPRKSRPSAEGAPGRGIRKGGRQRGGALGAWLPALSCALSAQGGVSRSQMTG